MEQLGAFRFGPELYTRAEALDVLKRYVVASMRLATTAGITLPSDRSHVRCAGDEVLCSATLKGQLKTSVGKSGRKVYPDSLKCVSLFSGRHAHTQILFSHTSTRDMISPRRAQVGKLFLDKMKAHHAIYRVPLKGDGAKVRKGHTPLPPLGAQVVVKKGHPQPIAVIVARNKQGGGRKMLTTIQGLETYDISSRAVEKEVCTMLFLVPCSV